MKSYLIAFGSKPKVGFLSLFRKICEEENVELRGATLANGPGCVNLALMLDDDVPERFVALLTMALMPAKYEIIGNDPLLEAGKFQDLLHN